MTIVVKFEGVLGLAPNPLCMLLIERKLSGVLELITALPRALSIFWRFSKSMIWSVSQSLSPTFLV